MQCAVLIVCRPPKGINLLWLKIQHSIFPRKLGWGQCGPWALISRIEGFIFHPNPCFESTFQLLRMQPTHSVAICKSPISPSRIRALNVINSIHSSHLNNSEAQGLWHRSSCLHFGEVSKLEEIFPLALSPTKFLTQKTLPCKIFRNCQLVTTVTFCKPGASTQIFQIWMLVIAATFAGGALCQRSVSDEVQLCVISAGRAMGNGIDHRVLWIPFIFLVQIDKGTVYLCALLRARTYIFLFGWNKNVSISR